MPSGMTRRFKQLGNSAEGSRRRRHGDEIIGNLMASVVLFLASEAARHVLYYIMPGAIIT